MAHTKAIGSTQLGRDSRPKYRGVKLFGGEKVKTGSIIVRQVGNKFVAGKGVRTGSDYTLYAIKEGVVKFQEVKKKKFDGSRKEVKLVHVV